MNIALLRREALDAKNSQWAGTIVLARPIPMRVAAAVAALLVLAISLFLIFGEYTRKLRVTGQIVPSAGSIKVVASQFGRIVTRMVEDGASVTVGQPLFELTAERAGNGGGVDLRIEALLAARTTELLQTRQLQTEELTQRAQALAIRQRSIEAEIASREQEIALQNVQIRSARDKLDRHARLATQEFLSLAQLGLASDEVTTQLARRKALERR